MFSRHWLKRTYGVNWNRFFTYQMPFLVMASGSRWKGSNAPNIRSPVVDEETKKGWTQTTGCGQCFVFSSALWHYWLGDRKDTCPHNFFSRTIVLSAFSALTLFVGLQWWGTGVVICLERGANDLHMGSWCHCQPIISCSSKIQNGLPFWCWITQVVLEKRTLNGCSSRVVIGGRALRENWLAWVHLESEYENGGRCPTCCSPAVSVQWWHCCCRWTLTLH